MKCPKCGADNPDSAKYCVVCAVPIEHETKAEVKPGMPKKKKTMIIGGIAAVIIVAILLMILLSPAISPIVEVRDRDSDGVPDSSDKYPDNPSYWSDGSGTLVITVHSDHVLFAIDYSVSVNGDVIKTGSIPAGSSKTISYEMTFPIGITDNYAVTVLATASGGGFGSTSDTATRYIVDGQSYNISLTV